MYQLTFAIITPALVIGAYAERVKFSGMLLFSLLWLLLVYCPVAHWVWGDGWLAQDGAHGFRGRHGRAPERGRRGAGLRAGARPAQGISGYAHAAAQHDHDGDRRVHAVGGLVRLQRRQRARGRRRRGHGDAGDAHRRGDRRVRVDGVRVGALRQALGARHRDRHGRRARHDHAGVGLRRPDGRARDRRRRRHRVLLRHQLHEAGAQGRRLARRLPGARRGRHDRHDPHRRVRGDRPSAASAIPRK